MFKKVLLLLLLAMILTPQLVLAVGADQSQVPEYNSVCWKKKPCADTRAALKGWDISKLTPDQTKELEDGFVTGTLAAPCVGGDPSDGWGRCLPPLVAKTEIAFGGRRTFLNIGEFIQKNYIFAVSIAGILAVLMVIIAGFQMVASGGNAEIITSSKKRIAGAIIGLFIAYSSYLILGTINPALVNLTLPQAWMTRPIALIPAFCSVSPSSTFAQAAEPEDQLTPVTTQPDFTNPFVYANPAQRSEFFCGRRFFVKDGGGQTCFGDVCDDGKVCINIPFAGKGAKEAYSCISGQLFIHYEVSPLYMFSLGGVARQSGLGTKYWLDKGLFVLYGVCKKSDNSLVIGNKWEEWDGGSEMMNVTSKSGDFLSYDGVYGGFDTAHEESHWNCPTDSKLAGFVIKTEVHSCALLCGFGLTVNPDDNLSIGYRNGSLVYGAWGVDVMASDYLPMEKLKAGIIGNVTMDKNIFEHIDKFWSTEPSN